VFGAAGDAEVPEAPYEKVLFQQGDWYSEYMNYQGEVNFLVGYRGNRETDQMYQSTADPIPMKIGADSIVTSIYVPYSYPPEMPDLDAVDIFLQDETGVGYGPFRMEPNLIQGETEPESATDADGNEVLIEATPQTIFVDYILTIDDGLFLQKGNYILHTTDNSRFVRNSQTGYAGAAMVTGVDYDAWMKYLEELDAAAIATDPRFYRKI
jgi:hypothetical protein